MLIVFTMAAVLWIFGGPPKAPKHARMVLLGALCSTVILIQIALPVGHPLKEATGGDIRLWLLIFAFFAVIFGYKTGLNALRNHAERSKGTIAQANAPQDHASHPEALTPSELERYSRHIMLKEIGGLGQIKLKAARVLVIGAGGLGAPALQYLNAAGVGTIGLIDDDHVELSNLQRQIIHHTSHIGAQKTHSAHAFLTAQNPSLTLNTYTQRLGEHNVEALISDYDYVLDGSDNFHTRTLVNQTCITLKRPLIFAALSQWEGQVSCIDLAQNTPCYQCIFPTAPESSAQPSCAASGVFAPLAGIIGTLMAAEAIKIITHAGEPLYHKLMIYDALYAQTHLISAKPQASCPACAQHRT